MIVVTKTKRTNFIFRYKSLFFYLGDSNKSMCVNAEFHPIYMCSHVPYIRFTCPILFKLGLKSSLMNFLKGLISLYPNSQKILCYETVKDHLTFLEYPAYYSLL